MGLAVALPIVLGVAGALLGALNRSFKAAGFDEAVGTGFFLGSCVGLIAGVLIARRYWK